MSSATATTATAGNDVGPEEGLLIGAAVIGLLIALVVLRFAFNTFLDVCILRQDPRRTWKEWTRSSQQWWRRTRAVLLWGGDNDNNDNAHQRDNELPGVASLPLDTVGATGRNRLASSEVELEKKNELCRMHRLLQVLPESILTEQDIEQWKEKHDSTTTTITTLAIDQKAQQQGTTISSCSICLQELCPGDRVFWAQQCDHVFHKPCIVKWMDRSLHCPNCRMQLVSSSILEQALVQTNFNGDAAVVDLAA